MDDRFFSSGRFQIVRQLGRGASGEVFEAYDREQGASVAIKALSTAHPRAIARFKREFRSLQHLEHQNLISFGELLEDNGRLLFTMELIRGVDIVSYVRHAASEAIAHADTKIASSGDSDRSSDAVGPTRARHGGTVDESRLRRCLLGLCRGLFALHGAGKVHRDIKASNVLVAEDGRVVILDLGLLSDLHGEDSWTSAGIVGTPHYMAPEQAAGGPCGPAADWYSVGVLLYEALTGQLPYDGAPLKVLVEKQQRLPPDPATVRPGLPPDLTKLCMELLRFDPSRRPTGRDLLRRLGRGAAATPGERPVPETITQGFPFVGRRAELDALAGMLATCTEHERPVVGLIHGESGLGKSALIDEFTTSLDSHVTVLSGRCYERESVSYKAFDGIVSTVARMLAHTDPVEAAALLPFHASLLSQVFPVLKRVKAFANAPHVSGASLEHQELRARVFGALRELLTRLAQRRPVVIAIDDLQWADDDSLALMADMFRPPHAPPLLLVGSVRPTGANDEVDAQRLARLRALCPDVREIELAPLSDAESYQLAEMLRDAHGVAVDLDTAALCQDAAGHPLFIDELVRHAADFGATSSKAPTLDDALWSRVSVLEPKVRELLEVVTLAGNALHLDTIMHAADVQPEQFGRMVSVLRVSNLVRTTGARASDTIEPYHDRVRRAVTRQLDPERASQIHRALALALEGSLFPAQEPMLAFHWSAAGRADVAARYSASAAERAADALAFDRAARFFRVALELGHPNRDDLLVKLGDCLANAGRGADAADAYEEAAATTSDEALEIDVRRRAAEQLLISGHIERGLNTISTVLQALGMRLPRTSRGALLSLVVRRMQLWARGLRFRARQGSAVAAAELMRVDLCFAIATGLANVDTIRGADFQTRHTLLALRAGEPTRVARALAIEGGFSSTAGRAGRRRAERLFAAANELLERHPSAHAAALVVGARCISAFQAGQWERALELAREGERAIREQRTGAAWQGATIQFFLMYSLAYLGELRELATRVPEELHSATERGDLYAATNLRNGLCNTAWLIRDDLDEARRQLDLVTAQWTRDGYHVQHYHHMLASVNAHLYAGDGVTGHELVASQWRSLERSQLLRVEAVRIEAWHLRARVALARCRAEPGEDGKHVRQVRRMAHRLLKAKAGWATGLAHLVLGATDEIEGDRDHAALALERASDAFTRANMPIFDAAARWRRGTTIGGDRGGALTAQAEAELRERGVVAPARFVAMLAPGFT